MGGLISVFAYAGVAKKTVTRFKYRLVRDLVATMVELMISDGEWALIEKKQMVVVGVPLHPRRLRWRGFNQAELLGEASAEALGWKYVSEVLERVRYTTPQMELKGTQRRVNLVGAFAPGKAIKAVKDQPVLLVDDVWTTGATMRECAKVLRLNGAKEVYGLTFARSVARCHESD